jgi:hypothetical protein
LNSARRGDEADRSGQATGWNRVSALVSAGCAIHCTALPIMAAVVPALGVRYAGSDRLEWGITVAVLAGLVGHCQGYLRHHGQAGPVLLFLFGVGAIVFTRWFALPATIAWATLGLGGVFAAGAHMLNVRYCRSWLE